MKDEYTLVYDEGKYRALEGAHPDGPGLRQVVSEGYMRFLLWRHLDIQQKEAEVHRAFLANEQLALGSFFTERVRAQAEVPGEFDPSQEEENWITMARKQGGLE